MISYAQNGEDVLLNRVFGHQTTGYYVDVGAGHPWIDSVTQHFYAQGWSGINIEPRPEMFRLLSRHRGRDVNLQCCVSDRRGQQKFYHVHWPGFDEVGEDGGGLSTLDPISVEGFRNEAVTVREYDVQVKTLTEICEEHRVNRIDFLKVDVEGHERQVLSGLNLRRFRPRALVIEATVPLTSTPCHQVWESIVLSADYLLATDDGVNRYYVRAEDRELVPLLQSPIGPYDKFIKYPVLVQERAEEGRLEAASGVTQRSDTLAGRIAALLTSCVPKRAKRWFRRRSLLLSGPFTRTAGKCCWAKSCGFCRRG